MNRNITFEPGEFYHLYNRGVDKRITFEDEADRRRFTTLLYISNGSKPVHLSNQEKLKRGLSHYDENIRGDSLVNIVAYCLMPNHFHVLVQEKETNGVSKFMQKLSTGYTMYFNKKNERSGTLFQGRFKATHASEDVYLRYLLSYIHLNPVKLIDPDWKEAGLNNLSKTESYLNQYKYSSYLDYRGVNRIENKIVTMNAYPQYFDTSENLQNEIRDWLTLSKIIKVEP